MVCPPPPLKRRSGCPTLHSGKAWVGAPSACPWRAAHSALRVAPGSQSAGASHLVSGAWLVRFCTWAADRAYLGHAWLTTTILCMRFTMVSMLFGHNLFPECNVYGTWAAALVDAVHAGSTTMTRSNMFE